MAFIPEQQTNLGYFIPSTNSWDVQSISSVDIGSQEFKDLIVQLHQNINNIAVALNAKETGFYVLEEFMTGANYFNPNIVPNWNSTTTDGINLRPEFRKTFNIGALGGGITTIAHGLNMTATWQLVSAYGAASNTTTHNFYPLPFSSATGANNIEVKVNATNIVITNNSGVTFLSSTIVLRFLKF